MLQSQKIEGQCEGENDERYRCYQRPGNDSESLADSHLPAFGKPGGDDVVCTEDHQSVSYIKECKQFDRFDSPDFPNDREGEETVVEPHRKDRK